MDKIIFNALEAMFGGGLITEISEKVIGPLSSAIVTAVNGKIGIALNLFSGLAMSLMVIYFFMDLTNQASRDLFTFERLITAFVRLLVAFAIMLFLQELITGLVKIGDGMFKWVSGDTFHNSMFSDSDDAVKFLTIDGGTYTWAEMPPVRDDSNAIWESVHKSIGTIKLSKILDVLGALMFSLVAGLVSLVCKALAYFTVLSTGIQIIARAIFAPLAIVQLFEDGTKSAGMRYLKKFLSKCLSLAVMIVIMYAAQSLSNVLIANIVGSDRVIDISNADAIGDVFTFATLAVSLVSQFAIVGGMSAAGKLADDIVGV